MKTRWYQQLLSVVLVLAMLIQLLPMQIIALSPDNTMLDSATTSTSTETEQPPATIIGEDPSLRTETEKHFRLSDGSFLAVSYGMPVHYQDDEGSWQDIDNSLTLSTNQETYASANTQVATTFAADLSTGRLISSQNGDVSVTMYLLNGNQLQTMAPIGSGQVATMTTQPLQIQSALTMDNTVQATLVADVNVLPVTSTTNTNAGWTMEELIPEKLQSTVLYEDVYPGIDLRYTAYSHNVKEQIIVNTPQEAYRYDFFLELEGLTAVANADHSISLTDSEGDVCYTIPAPFMEDYIGATSTGVTYTLTPTIGGTILTVEADADWINHEDREFPVSIDPTLEATAGNSDDQIYATYVVEGTPGIMNPTHQHLYFGYGYHDTVKEQRIFMHFKDLPDIPAGSTVVDAQLGMYMFRITYQGCSDLGAAVYEVTEDKTTAYTNYRSWIGSFSWNSQPAYDTSNMIDYTVIDGNPADGKLHRYYYWDITELAKQWYENSAIKNRTVAMAITRANTAYGPSYCNVPVFMAYGDTNPPVLVVNYRDTTGVEEYYSYATLGVGSAGTAYIADATGQLNIVKGLVSYASSINPFVLNMVYNSSVPVAPGERLGYAMRVGAGWKLDVMQKIEAVTLGDTDYLKYHDGDGTVHYFLQSGIESGDTNYYDEDGLGLSIIKNGSTYILSDTKDNKYTFTNGLLTNIEDNNKNEYIIHIENQKITSIGQKNHDVAEETTVATFAYFEDDLISVTDAAGLVHTLDLEEGRLESISINGTVHADYEYADRKLEKMIDTESGYAIEVTYNGQDKVSSYAEYDRNDQVGVMIEVSYDGFDKTTYLDYGNDRIKGTADDLSTSYLFDHSGRTVNAYTTDAQDRIIGASTAVYHDGEQTDKSNNRTKRTATIGVPAEQEMLNSGFENTSSNTWTLTAGSSISTEKPRTGVYSLKVLAGQNGVRASKNSRTLYTGMTYTLSGYINTSQLANIDNFSVYFMARDVSGTEFRGENFSYRTLESVDDGWMRISMTFTAQVTGPYTISVHCTGGAGSIYLDDLQLERGSAPSNRNMLENGNIQESTTGWTICGSVFPTASYGLPRENETTYAMAVMSTPINANAKFYQTVPVNLSWDVTYILSGWAKGNAVPDNVQLTDYNQDIEKSFGLRAIINYTGGEKEYFYAPFNADITDWQFTSIAIAPSKELTVESITVECVYEKNGNRANFDNISLVRETVQVYDYDDDGNLISVNTPGIESDNNEYDDNGNLISTVTSEGVTYTYEYDNSGDYPHRLISATGSSTTQSMTYDAYGNVTSSVLSANTDTSLTMNTSNVYTNQGNLLRATVNANNILAQYQYSTAFSQMMGLPTVVQDGNGTSTNINYDQFGRVVYSVVDNCAALSYNYVDGNLKHIIRDGNYGDELKYIMYYDAFGNMTSFTINNHPIMTYEYGNKNGQLLKQSYCSEDGGSISYTYDNLGRLATATYPDGRMVSYTYNGDGQLYRVTEVGGDSPATYLYSYDTLGRLIASEKRDINGASILRIYQKYDAHGKLVGQSVYFDDSEYAESFSYTNDGLLETMITGTADTIQYGYDELQRLISIDNGVFVRNYTYKNASAVQTTGQISQLQYSGLLENQAYGYTYDAAGNVSTYSAPGKTTVTYTYDAQGQLLSAVGDQTYTYTYDSVGNIRTANGHTYAYGASWWPDLLTAYDGQTISYDNIGNPLNYFNGNHWTFTWENGRSLATATNDTTNITYAYDANGLRTSKTINGTAHDYLYVSGQLIRETYNGNILDFFYDASGCPYALNYNGSTYYYITNLQGDVMYLIDANENIVATYEYDPYGNIVSATGTMAEINPLRYRGYYYDAELEMYYLQSRYYDPQIGRFINADEFASTGQSILGCNMFAYCSNNPINNSDTSGRFWIEALIGAAVSVTTSYIAAKVTGQDYTWKDAAVAVACGVVNAIPVVGTVLSGAISGAYTGYVNYQNGASLEGAIVSGFVAGATTMWSLGDLAGFDTTVSGYASRAFVDTVFGTGYSCVSAGVNELVTHNATDGTVTGPSSLGTINDGVGTANTTSSVLTIAKQKAELEQTRIVNGEVIKISPRASYSRHDENRIYCYVQF